MGVYFGVALQKTEYNTAKLGELDIFALDGQFSECSEFCGWRSDLSIDYMPKKFRPFLNQHQARLVDGTSMSMA